MTWDCTFVIDGKAEEITLMTDDFEDVFNEYVKLKSKYKSVVFLEHRIHRKGRLILTEGMMGLPEEEPVKPIIDADANLRGNVQRVRNAAARGDIPLAQQRAGDGNWMDKHNADIARHQLRDPPA